MVHRLALVFLIGHAFLSDFLSAENIKLNIDYQIHSNNDLKQFRQVLLKGARKFKFDPHFVSNQEVCGSTSPDCFLLNHDTPSTSISSYNTSTELLNYLAGSEFAKLTNNEYVSVALCFKSAPDKCNMDSVKFQSWLKLVDDFHAQALATVPSNVEFILDGDAKPSNCMVGRWLPWKSVWIVGDSATASAFTSNSQENDNYRFTILNNPENFTNWEWMATPEVNYGKFSSNGTDYPYQLWEPDMQEDILKYKDLYLSGPQHAAGYHFAINSDIAMFRVFSSAASKLQNTADVPYGINQMLDTFAGSDTRVGENPLLLQINQEQYVSFYTSATDPTVLYFVILTVNVDTYTVTSAEPVQLHSDYSSHLHLTTDNRLNQALKWYSEKKSMDYILLITEGGYMVCFQFSATAAQKKGPLNLHLDAKWTETAVPYYGKILSSDGTDKLYDVVVNENACKISNHACDMAIQAVYHNNKISDNNTVIVQSFALDMFGAANDDQATHENYITANILNTKAVTTPYTTFDSMQLAPLYNENNSILLFVSSNLLITASDISSDAAAWVVVSAGKHISVSVDTVTDMLLLTNDYGYCYNSHTHNTRSYPTVCASSPVPSEYTLDYSLGSTTEWLNLLHTSTCTTTVDTTNTTLCFAVNACHDSILHGSYDQGSIPVAVLSSLDSQQTEGGKKPFLLEVHQGIPTNMRNIQASHGGCGEPIHRDGVVLDSFRVDEWVHALKTVSV